MEFFTSCKMWNMFKVNNKGTGIRKVNDKVKNKDTIDVVLASLLLTLNPFNFLLQCFFCWFWSRWISCTSKMHLNTWERVTFSVNFQVCETFSDVSQTRQTWWVSIWGPHIRGREGGGWGLAYIQRETYFPGVN